MSKILITGCAGMLGSSLCHWLIGNTEHAVIGIDDMSGGFIENMPERSDRFRFVRINVNDVGLLNNVYERFNPEITYCMHAYASEGRANHIRRFIHKNNTLSTLNVINACVNYNSKLIFTSSVAVYSGMPPFDEETLPNPVDEYGLSKFCSEKSIQIAGKEQGLEWVIIRPRNIYGIRQNIFDASRNLFGIFCYNALNDLPLTIFGEGYHKRSFTYIDDILEPLYNCIKYDKQIFNLGSKYIYSIKQATEMFCEVSGYKNVIHIEERSEVPEAYCLTEKSEQLLAFKDNTTLYEGLKKMYSWAAKQKMRERLQPPKLEVIKNTHSSLL